MQHIFKFKIVAAWKKIEIKEESHIPVRRMAPSDTGDRQTE